MQLKDNFTHSATEGKPWSCWTEVDVLLVVVVTRTIEYHRMQQYKADIKCCPDTVLMLVHMAIKLLEHKHHLTPLDDSMTLKFGR